MSKVVEPFNVEFSQDIVGDVVALKAKDDNLFVDQAKEAGIDTKTLKLVEGFRKEYLDKCVATAKAAGQKALEENKDAASVTVELPYTTSSNNDVTINITREKTYRGMNGSPDVTKAAMAAIVTDSYNKPTKSYMKEAEASMTLALLGIEL